ncbi:lifeguard 1 [Chlorella sorokiniana]|uniref:Lifeguard 1 n=1 Tax=Chlorella sorokiniana TaxID=3076 RepID=A0A2P6TYT4_CHLSO|nr:lifeguard 1 [Chlorella sorokiniana]|eukprot:PRW59235.1 lifeguard 1 [Chlorella sorokiniana]
MGQGNDPRAGPPPPGYPSSYPPPQGYPPQQPPAGAWGYGAPPGAAYPPPQQGFYAQPPLQAYPPQQPGYYPQQQQGLPARPPGAAKPPGFDAYDVEAAQAGAAAAAFMEQKVRAGFIRKVMIIVFLQLCVTVGVAATFMFVQPLRDYVRPGGPGQWVFIVAWVLSLVALIAIMCSSTLRRKHPYNIMALFAFTCIMAVLVGTICSYWDVAVVLTALAVTAAAVAGLTVVAIFGKFDMTKRGGLLAMASMVVLFVLIVTLVIGFFYVSKWWYLALSVVLALLFSAYLVYDIQLLVGGKSVAFSPDEYVAASLQIYLDVVNLFLAILNIVGIASSN